MYTSNKLAHNVHLHTVYTQSKNATRNTKDSHSITGLVFKSYTYK